MRRRTTAKLEVLHNLEEVLENCRNQLEDAKDLTEEALAKRRSELTEALERIHSGKRRSVPAPFAPISGLCGFSGPTLRPRPGTSARPWSPCASWVSPRRKD